MGRILTAVRVIEARARLWPYMFPTSIHRTALALASMRAGVHVEAKPRRWRKLGPHEYTLRMGPVTVVVIGAASIWRWHAAVMIGNVRTAIFRDWNPHPRAQCQANAIAAVEAWRDSIR